MKDRIMLDICDPEGYRPSLKINGYIAFTGRMFQRGLDAVFTKDILMAKVIKFDGLNHSGNH